MTDLRYDPEHCSHENATTRYQETHPGQFEAVVVACPDCGIGLAGPEIQYEPECNVGEMVRGGQRGV